MRKTFLYISIIFISLNANAQFFLTGTESFGTHWKQIKTNNHRIIFPADAENIAIGYANLLSVIDTVTSKSLLAKQRKFDVVIHNHSTLSNAFVAWAPKRMEVISQYPSSIYAQPWLTQLALHETRHTSQMFKLNGGIVRPVSLFFGEIAVGGAAGFVPSWFMEGDAVTFETAASNSGRGRQADFYQYYRAHYLTRSKKFKYDKWLLGSYKDNIPNHYNFGYQLTSYAKLKYGNQVWANTLRYVSRYPFTVFPFYFGLKQQTGLSRKHLFKKTFNNLDSIWLANASIDNHKEYISLIRNNREYSDYRYPYFLNDSTLIIYKTNLSDNPCFIKIDLKTKKERKLLIPGYLTGIPSYYNENIFWTEYKPHIRWEYKNFSVVKWYNSSTKKIKTIAKNGRYFSPIYNPEDKLVYVISGKDDGTSFVEAFSLNGKIEKSIPITNNYEPVEITIDPKNETLFSVVVSDKGKSIIRIYDDGTTSTIYGPTYLDIHSLKVISNLVFFSTSFGYKEDIFAFDIISKKVYQQTRTEFGATDPFINQQLNEIVFSNYASDGYYVSRTSIDTTENVILPNINDDIITRGLTSTESINVDSVVILRNSYPIKNYRGIKDFINVHSWTPFYFDPYKLTTGEAILKPGFTVFSQNLTGSSVLVAGYGYDNSSITNINYQYFGLFPVISFNFELSNISPSIFYVDHTNNPKTDKQRRESTISIYTPLTLSKSKFSTYIYPYIQAIYSNDYFYSESDSKYHKGLTRLNYRVYFSATQRISIKSIRPRFGLIADLNLEDAPFNKNNLGSLLSEDFSLYLPGIFITHSFLIKHSFQKQKLENYYFSNKIIFPRGYTDYYSEKYKSISFEYLMPIAYPDFALGSLAYLKRISLNGFFDYARNQFPYGPVNYAYNMRSFGYEIFIDLKLLRTRYPIRLKFQQGWAGSNLLPFNSFSIFIDYYSQ